MRYHHWEHRDWEAAVVDISHRGADAEESLAHGLDVAQFTFSVVDQVEAGDVEDPHPHTTRDIWGISALAGPDENKVSSQPWLDSSNTMKRHSSHIGVIEERQRLGDDRQAMFKLPL